MNISSAIFHVREPEKNKPYRELERLGTSGVLKKRDIKLGVLKTWNQKCVVILNGCIYIFKDELGRTFDKAFSLFGYNEVSRAPEIRSEEAKYPFKICYALGEKNRMKCFSADSEKNRSEWMTAIKEEMRLVHKLKTSKESDADTSMDSMEIPISTSEYIENLAENCTRFSDSGYVDSDTESCESCCCSEIEVNPACVKWTCQLPQPPKVDVDLQTKSGPSISQRKEKTKPSPRPPVPSKPNLAEAARWNGTPAEGQRVLVKYGREGTYMVRSSSDGSDTLVLLVIFEYQPRKYKIYHKNQRMYIDENGEHFPNINSLIMYYRRNYLPNQRVMLKEPYTICK